MSGPRHRAMNDRMTALSGSADDICITLISSESEEFLTSNKVKNVRDFKLVNLAKDMDFYQLHSAAATQCIKNSVRNLN